jgi:TP901 family phage tail tape measure protein
MANETIVTNIVANANFSSLIANVQKATAELAQLKGALATTNKSLAMDAAKIQQGFSATLRSTGQFSTHFVSLSSDVEKFGKNLDQGRLKLKDYYRTFQDHTRTSGGMIRELARQQVQLQNAILQPLGRNAEGLMQFNVQIPRGLDATKNKTALLKQEMQIFNKVIQDGGVQLINWGKNTQWAGRQLTVGLTVPITAFGIAASKAFREADEQLVRLTKVYGGVAQTSATELAKVRKEVSATARELAAAYGASYKETIALAADIAATGKQGDDLIRSTQETTRLSILGEVDRQEAMKATLAIQTAFKQNTTELSESINFLNAVENQTSTSLADLVEAIPKAGPVIQSLGGSVQDLALYLTAMKEGGVNASEGANAIKSSLASLINPTKVAKEMFQGFGIDLENIVTSNAGNLTGMMLELQSALDKLDPLSKSKAIEQLFGKFQFARLSALFENLGKEGSQTLQVLDLMKTSTQDLANIANRELSQITESASGKYKRALESLKASLAGVGEQFLNIGTFFINIIDKVVQFANKLPDPIKKLLTFAAGFTALTGPIIMLTGVLANFLGYIVKGASYFRALFKGGEGWKLLTPEILAANKAGNLLETTFYSDAKAATVLSTALHNLNEEFRILQARANSGVSAAPTISTVAGQVVMTGTAIREVDPTSRYISPKDTRAYSHPNPVSAMTPAEREAQTIFGIVPGAPKVNNAISNNPQMYMSSDLPKVAGVSAIKDVSTGIVAGEAAKWHAMTGALAMQSEAEIALLKREVAATGLITTSLSDSYQALLPQMSRITTLAATESAEIVAQLQASKITVDQARARVVALNRQIEMMMGQAATEVATAQGRTINLTQLPLVDQPAFDPVTGKANMKELTRPGRTRTLFNSIARVLGVKTYGAPYSIETTRPKRFNVGGDVESFGPNKTVVSGPSSINYDDRFGNVPLGGYVLNQGASLDPRNKDLVDAAPSTFSNSGSTMKAMLTPKETIFGPGIHRDPELYAAVDAANNGYAFGGDVSRNKNNYGLIAPRAIVKASDLRRLFPGLLGKTHTKDEYEFKGTQGVFGGDVNNPKIVEANKIRLKLKDAIITRSKINKYMEKDGVPPDVLLSSIMSGTGSSRLSTDRLLDGLASSGIINLQQRQEISDQAFESYALALAKLDLVNDHNNPVLSASRKAIMSSTAIGTEQRRKALEALDIFASTPGMVTDVSSRGTSGFLKSIRLSDGTIIPLKTLEGSSTETFFHAPKPDELLEKFNVGGNIPGGNIKKGRSKYGIPSLASSAISRLTARWKPQQQFRMPGYQYTLGNQDPLHGPLQIGRTMVPKDRQDDYEWTREVIYKDDRFARQNVMRQFPIGSEEERGKYILRQYMAGNYGILQTPGATELMKKMSRKFSGTLYRGLKLSKNRANPLPQNIIEAIDQARLSGDPSGLIGQEFIMRRSSWSKKRDIASLFAPGHGASADGSSILIEASVKNRNVVPASDIFPDAKFSAPFGQKVSGHNSRSEQESIFGGKFRVVGYENGTLKLETVVDGTRAMGGPVNANRPYLVGENGPEIFVPRNSGGIIPGGDIVKNRTGYGLPNIPTMPGYETPLATQMGMTPVTQNQSSGYNPYGMKAQGLGMAASIGAPVLGQMMGGNTGMMIGMGLGQVAQILPFIIKGTFTFSKMLKMITIPGLVITGLISIGKYLLDLKKKAEDVGKANRLAFGGNEKTLGEAGLAGKYKTLSTRLKNINDELSLTKAKAAAAYDSNTKTGINGLTFTIKQLREETARVKKEMPETIASFNNIDETKVNDLATSLKSQYVAMGMSVEKATNSIYALISASNKSSQAVSAISSSSFKEIVDGASAAAASIKIVTRALAANPDGNGKGFIEELNVGIEQMINNLSLYQQSLVGTKGGADGKTELTSADALKKTLEEIGKIKYANNELDSKTLESLKSQNLVLSFILGKGETLQSIYAKTAIYAAGLADKIDIASMSGDQALEFAKNLAVYQGALNDLTSSTASDNPLSALAKLYDAAKKASENATKASKAAAKFDADYYKDKIKAIQQVINQLEKERNARLKLLDVQQAEADFAKSLKEEQIKYQEFLAAGDLAAAAQSQLNIKKLQEDRQRQLTRESISTDYEKRIEQQNKEIERLQKILEDAEKNSATASSNAAKKSADLATIADFRARINAVITRNPDGQINSDDKKILMAIFDEMRKAGGDIKKAADEMLKPYSGGVSGLPDVVNGKPVAPTSPEVKLAMDLAAKLNAKEGVFSKAVDKFIEAVDKFAGTTAGTGAGTKFDPIKSPTVEKVFKDEKSLYKNYMDESNGKWTRAGEIYFENYPEKFGVKKGKPSYFEFNGRLYNWDGSDLQRDPVKRAMGGNVKQYDGGGNVSGPGTSTSDSIPAMLSDGEWVIKADSVKRAEKEFGPSFFSDLNAGRFANGGKVSKMGTADSMIKTAESMLGYQEGKNNDTIFGRFAKKAYDLQSRYIAWCGAFINWAAKNSGVDLASMIWTPGGAQSFMKSGKWTKMNPARGDLAFMDFPGDGVNRISHVGLVRNVLSNNTVSTIEGNTSGSGSQRSGGGVLAKIRQYNMKNAPIVGFGRPSYKPVDAIEYNYGKEGYYGPDDAKSDYENSRYTVTRGDTLSSIAKKYKVTVKQLMEMNPQLNDPRYMGGSRIFAGTKVNIKKFAEGGKVTNSLTDSGSWINSLSWKKPKSAYNSKNQPTGSPYGRYWGELERLYQQSPLGFDKNGKPIFNNAGKDPWGGTEIPGLPFSGTDPQHSDYWHQLAEQPKNYSSPRMGVDRTPDRYAGSGASMGGIGNGAYGLGPLMFANGGLVKRQSLLSKVMHGLLKTMDPFKLGKHSLGYNFLGGKEVANVFSGTGNKSDYLSAALLPLGGLGRGAAKLPGAISKLTPEMKSFQMSDIDSKAMQALSNMDLSSIKIPETGISFNPASAKAGLEALKEGVTSSSAWEIVQAQRETLLKNKYPKVDLSDVAKFNEYYAKEFYGLLPDDSIKLFKGVRSTAGGSWRTGEKDLATYFSTNPHIAALYSAMIGKAKLGDELPMFGIDRRISDLRNFLGEGAVRNGNAQGSMEFPQLLGGKDLSDVLPSIYSLPGQVYGQMFGGAATSLTKIKNLWPSGFAHGGLVGGAPHGLGMSSMVKAGNNKKPSGQSVWSKIIHSAMKTIDPFKFQGKSLGYEFLGGKEIANVFSGTGKKMDYLSAALAPLGAGKLGLPVASGTTSAIKNSTKILRNLKGKALEFAKADGRNIPEMIVDNVDAETVNTMAQQTLRVSPTTDLAKAYHYYWGNAYDILVKQSDKAVDGMSKEQFMDKLSRSGITGTTSNSAASSLGSDFMKSANRAYAISHGLNPDDKISLYKAVSSSDTEKAFGGYWSLSSQFAGSYLKNLGLRGGNTTSSTISGLFKVDMLPEQVPTPLSIGALSDEYATMLSPELVNSVGGATKIGKGLPGHYNGPDRRNFLQDFYKFVPGVKIPQGQRPSQMKDLLKIDLNSKEMAARWGHEDYFKQFLDAGVFKQKNFANGGIVNTSFNPNMSVPGFANGGMASPTYNIPTNTVGIASNQVPGYNKGGSIHHYNAGGIVVNAAQGQDVKELANHIVNIMDARGARRQSMNGGGITV